MNNAQPAPVMKGKRSGRPKRRAASPLPERTALGHEHLNIASPAILQDEINPRSARRPPDDASVQDPLLDWPED